MKRRTGPRPLAIRVFVAAFLAAAVIRLGQGLADLPLAQLALALRAPWFAWDRDWTIVALSAEFTIALIPIVWIHLFGAPFARWLVLGFGALKLWGMRRAAVFAFQAGSLDPLALTEPVLVLVAMLSLLTADAGRWFARPEESGPAVFE